MLHATLVTLFVTALAAQVAPVESATAPDPAKCPPSTVPLAAGLSFADTLTVRSGTDFLRDFAATTVAGLAHAVIEIPAGTDEKWEVKADGVLRWDIKDGKPRHVRYLGYPCNYGMIPRTLLGKELGGDGDPLDVLVLGAALPRGTVVPVRVIGLIRLVDAGDKDDKLIAVAADSALVKAETIADLDGLFPGITSILRTWFENYKGKDALKCAGFGAKTEADALLAAGIASFALSEKGKTDAAGGKKAPAPAGTSDKR